VFGIFFDIVADTIRDLLGTEWSVEMGEAWNRTLTSLHFYAENPDQTATAIENGLQ